LGAGSVTDVQSHPNKRKKNTRQAEYLNVTLRAVQVTIVEVEKQKLLHIMSVSL